jgi:hypothetical protein
MRRIGLGIKIKGKKSKGCKFGKINDKTISTNFIFK